MEELGIFSDEGMIDGPFYSLEEAARVMAVLYVGEDGVHVAECCHDHPGQKRDNCEECAQEAD